MERLIKLSCVIFVERIKMKFIFQVDTHCINVSILTWYCIKGI